MTILKRAETIAALGLATALALPATALALPVIDGAIDTTSEGWTEVTSLADSGDGGIKNFYWASDGTNLYFGAKTSDDDDGKNRSIDGFDIFNINIGLDGNTAPWRYRARSENGSFAGSTSEPVAGQGDWQTLLDGGDDSSTSGGFGEPAGVAKLDQTGLGYAVDLDGGHRTHEFAIPWATLLDGNNGWDVGSSLDLRVGGFYAEDGSIFEGFGLENADGVPGGIAYGDQSTYALIEDVPAAVPLPAAGWFLLTVFGGLGLAARRRCKVA